MGIAKQTEGLRGRIEGQRLEQQNIEVLLALVETVASSILIMSEGLAMVQKELFGIKEVIRGNSLSIEGITLGIDTLNDTLMSKNL
ncbi:hypothetical protein LCGC14_1347940 [marine sediment metagenome]|uniref:Uncharacterized protein n=1 Tax=marine sediment metagenome TaxID=412755 RepID=A0A0F9KBT4_9ZZZZ